MMWKWAVIAFALLGLLSLPLAHAADEADAEDATITVVDDDATPDDIVRVIELPDPAAGQGNANTATGPQNVNAAQGGSAAAGHDFGQQTAEEARSRNNAEQVRAEAKQQGRSEARGDNASDNRRGPPH
jgi:hypothetical protein